MHKTLEEWQLLAQQARWSSDFKGYYQLYCQLLLIQAALQETTRSIDPFCPLSDFLSGHGCGLSKFLGVRAPAPGSGRHWPCPQRPNHSRLSHTHALKGPNPLTDILEGKEASETRSKLVHSDDVADAQAL